MIGAKEETRYAKLPDLLMLLDILTQCGGLFASHLLNVITEDGKFAKRSTIFSISEPVRIELWISKLHDVGNHLLPRNPDMPDWTT